MKTIELIRKLVQKDEDREVALVYTDNGIFVYDDNIEVQDMIHQWQHIVWITIKKKDDDK